MNARTTSVKETKFYSQKQKKRRKVWENGKRKKKKLLVYVGLESPGVDD